MKPDSITIPFTVTFDPAGQELAELARHIVTRLTDEGALDEAAEHGHGIMATSAAIEWARERLGNQIPAVPEPAPNAGASALYGPGETLEQLARTGELDRAAGLEFAEELAATVDDLDVDPRSEAGIELALARQEERELAAWHPDSGVAGPECYECETSGRNCSAHTLTPAQQAER